jgi:DNA-binding FadR family transcriptional regulator
MSRQAKSPCKWSDQLTIDVHRRESAAVQLRPVSRQSLPSGVFEQLSEEILAGRIAAGDALPAERTLTASFGVNRQAVREALQRLAQIGLVEIRQGEPTRVRDFRRTAGLDVLGRLMTDADGSVDPAVIRSVMELRAAVGPDAARLCALRATPTVIDHLGTHAGALVASDDLAVRARHSIRFWDAVIDGSDNIAYRLLFNGLMQIYEPVSALLAPILEPELRDNVSHTGVVAAVAAGDARSAESAARQLLSRGTFAVNTALEHR